MQYRFLVSIDILSMTMNCSFFSSDKDNRELTKSNYSQNFNSNQTKLQSFFERLRGNSSRFVFSNHSFNLVIKIQFVSINYCFLSSLLWQCRTILEMICEKRKKMSLKKKRKKSNVSYFIASLSLYLIRWNDSILFFHVLALDEADIALLKTYVSLLESIL